MADGGGNAVSGAVLRSYLERIERLIENRKAVGDDIKAVYAEAKANGYTPRYLKAVIKLRAMPAEQRDEDTAMMELYLGAIGMTRAAPLFAATGLMGEDAAAREAVIEGLKAIVPPNTEIIFKCAGTPVRVWRDLEGNAHAEDWREPEPKAPRERKAGKPPADPDAPVLPDLDEGGAILLGRADAAAGKPITANPFPFGDRRRARWDFGWRDHTGSDGMGPDDGGDE